MFRLIESGWVLLSLLVPLWTWLKYRVQQPPYIKVDRHRTWVFRKDWTPRILGESGLFVRLDSFVGFGVGLDLALVWLAYGFGVTGPWSLIGVTLRLIAQHIQGVKTRRKSLYSCLYGIVWWLSGPKKDGVQLGYMSSKWNFSKNIPDH